ncbi:TonB-dependent receptor [Chitinophaga sp.]|uniref:SusC/RagA family TonB-linked outer membrane protein n=1 Tax=Chitinophaga sp. TaxID=1869181 RepID=UPI0031E25CE6
MAFTLQQFRWKLLVLLLFFSSVLSAQQTTQIKGSVISGSGETLEGVSVSISETGKVNKLATATTNNKGVFLITNLKAANRYDLIFTHIGYEDHLVTAYEVNNNENNSLVVRLKQVSSNLNEVAVVGYGTQKKSAVTGAITTIKSADFNDRPITQSSQLFYGLVPGIFANANTSEAGNGQVTIRVRGVGTLNDAGALVLVDGIEAPIDNISPNDIESVTVLKDAAAAAIYGSRAANGVILVTTKRGKFNSKLRVGYNAYAGIASPTVLPDMVLDNATYLKLYKEAATNSNVSTTGITDDAINRYAGMPSTNWFDVIFRKQALLQDHTVNLNVGNENLSTYFSLDYLNQEGIVKKQGSQRYNSRLNVDIKLSPAVKAGASFSYSVSPADLLTKQGPEYITNSTDVNSLDGKGSLAFEAALSQHPLVPVYDSLGRYATLEQKLGIQRNRNNGQAILDNESLRQEDHKFLGNAYLSYEPIRNLEIKGTLALNDQRVSYLDTRKQYQNYDPVTHNLVSTVVPGSYLTDVQNFNKNVTSVLQASYKVRIKKHGLNLLAGINQESATQKSNAILQTGFPSTSLVTLGNGATTLVANTTQGEWALRSYFGRLGYDFANRYLFEVNFRRDGSSRFGQHNRFGNFPSFSAGWVLSNEAFWQFRAVNFLKLRASYGTLGNQNTALYPFASQVTFTNNYPVNNTNTGGGAINVLGNPDLKWESTTTTDLGINASLFNSSLTFEADYFSRNTKDILTQINNPLTLGVLNPTIVNAASVVNKGWEASLNYNFYLHQVHVSLGGNVTYVTNKVTAINPALTSQSDKVELNSTSAIWLIRGQPINAIYGYKVAGIFQNTTEIANAPDHSLFGNPQPGDFRIQDTDGDGKITNKDKVVLGSRQSKWLYGFNLKLNYKRFDFAVLFQGVGAVYTYQARQVGPFAFAGIRKYWLDRWTAEHPSTTIPRLWVDRSGYNGASIETLPSSFWVQNLAYLRIKNIQFGYTITKEMVQTLPVSSLRIYANAQNLFTFTKYKDFDPERLTTQQYVTNSLPQLKVLTVGVNVLF